MFQSMQRRITRELLDDLPSHDPRAKHSRRDLRRLNAWMRNDRIIARTLRKMFPIDPPLHITELGAGDGTLFLRIGRQLKWRSINLTLVDQQQLLDSETRAQFEEQGCGVRPVQGDVFDWVGQSDARADVYITNLFLHHFSEFQLADLFQSIARNTDVFIALEPRRAPWSYTCSRLVWLIGCGEVTRHDAPVSVRAGFNGRELSALWPNNPQWELSEHPAGAFSHLFVARRKRGIPEAAKALLQRARAT